ncbi:TetR/AcrR family transcriptional regulator [Pseudonocardia ailaonensis]|uniref:TetR/AcrR family transcriptional regulator n=1 Tax=Pseudonocardia ailaonensis TaxID=367279 RepID=A0ABN2NCM4_9PSEU
METAAPRKRVSRAERERQILEAAIAVFSERGYAAASMDAVAERVGVTKPVVYTHYGSKEGLLLACVSWIRSALLEATATAASSTDDPEEMLRRGTLAFFRFLDERSSTFALLFHETAIAEEAVEAIRAQQTDFIAGLLAAADPAADPVRLQGWAQVIVGACERLGYWRKQDSRITAEQATEYLMDLAWRGLANR